MAKGRLSEADTALRQVGPAAVVLCLGDADKKKGEWVGLGNTLSLF